MAGAEPSFHGIIGRSAAMRTLFDETERFAPVDVPILVRGESGTGKELVWYLAEGRAAGAAWSRER